MFIIDEFLITSHGLGVLRPVALLGAVEQSHAVLVQTQLVLVKPG